MSGPFGFLKEIGGSIGKIIGVAGDVLGIKELGPGLQAQRAARDQMNFAREQSDLNYKRQLEFADRSEAFQREFAKHGVSWRVEDAKAAGLHPLFAVGGSGASGMGSSFSPNPIVLPEEAQVAPVGQRVGQAADEWLARDSALKAAEASVEKDRAIADFYRSSAAKARQEALIAKPLPGPAESTVIQGAPNQQQPMEGYYDRRVVQANPSFSRDSNRSSVGAGSSPFWRSFEFSPGKMIDLPHTEEGPSEALENISIVQWPFVIAENMAHYGPQWLGEMASIVNPFIEAAQEKARGYLPRFEDRSWNRGE